MIIGSCGFGGTGSSVFTDLLREYDGIQVFDNFEFTLAYRVDGLQDLEFHLVKQYSKTSSGDYAIKRFLDMSKCYKTPFINKPCKGRTFYKLSKKYIGNIEQLHYRGIETVDMLTPNIMRNIFAFFSKKLFMKFFQKLFRKRLYWWPSRTIHFSIKPNNFYEATYDYIDSILISMGADLNKPICLDQPFEGNNPEQSMVFFRDSYAVIIDRDPRDLYLEYKYATNVDAKFFPHSNVDDFILYYRNLRQGYNDNDRTVRIRFEEFIYEYDESIKKLESIVPLGNHLTPRKWFDPNKSINNTQLIRKHPEDLEAIKKIEKELSEFLFPFENYPDVKITGKQFSGSGRKMTYEK